LTKEQEKQTIDNWNNTLYRLLDRDKIRALTPQDWADFQLRLGKTFHKELSDLVQDIRVEKIEAYDELVERLTLQQDAKIAEIQLQMETMWKERKETQEMIEKLMVENNATHSMLNQTREISKQIPGAPKNVIEQFFSDVRLLPMGGMAVSYLTDPVNSLFEVLYAHIEAAKNTTGVNWMFQLAGIFTTSMRILLAINIIVFIISSVLPGFLIFVQYFLRFIKWVDKTFSSKFSGWGEFKDTFKKFTTDYIPPNVKAGSALAISIIQHIFLGFSEGVQLTGGVVGVIAPLLLSLFALLSSGFSFLFISYNFVFLQQGGLSAISQIANSFINIIISGFGFAFSARYFLSPSWKRTGECFQLLFGGVHSIMSIIPFFARDVAVDFTYEYLKKIALNMT
jgi:hypothetical protein